MFPLRVLVADDHRLFRQGIIGLMKTRRDLATVVAEASTGREAVEMARVHHPDAILLDIAMPDGNGLQALELLRREAPQCAVIMLTASESNEDIYEAMRLGAAGYLLKSLDAADLFDTLTAVGNGEAQVTRAMAARLLKVIGQSEAHQRAAAMDLTEREMDVLRLVAGGASNQHIADQLAISINTVKTHLRNILVKLQLDNRTQVAAYAVQTGLAGGPAAHYEPDV